ncbi:PD-(D/E)XK nuclease-like domain-containing protein [Kiloniella majae]|uniref:PD-(D/E)XK nuclease-like domain-containing protein n=1 Tax=Kiloniella majae TaxID=1938558 RepID=UPI000A2794F5|nr:PD-(D/E)XK nuclease-like domain-containing protein [Kiloniella majae]
MIIDFNMPESEYHAYPALSVSGVKDLLVSPLDFWVRSWMNPEKEDKDTDAKKLGRAYHKRVLEGVEAFQEVYAIKPNKADHEDALVTCEDMRDWLNARKLPHSGSKAEITKRVLQADCNAPIWDLIVAEKTEGKEIISSDKAESIELAARAIEAQPGIGESFKDGRAEVSLFWEEDGTPMKSRLDYLKSAAIVDLKTFSNSLRKPVDVAVSQAVANNKYHIQGYAYLRGLEKIKKGLVTGSTKVIGDVDEAFLEAVANTKRHRFFFVFQQADGVPNVLAREFREFETYGGLGMTPNAYYTAGENGFHTGLALYRQCMEFFGKHKPWHPMTKPRPFVDTDFPMWMFD